MVTELVQSFIYNTSTLALVCASKFKPPEGEAAIFSSASVSTDVQPERLPSRWLASEQRWNLRASLAKFWAYCVSLGGGGGI